MHTCMTEKIIRNFSRRKFCNFVLFAKVKKKIKIFREIKFDKMFFFFVSQIKGLMANHCNWIVPI